MTAALEPLRPLTSRPWAIALAVGVAYLALAQGLGILTSLFAEEAFGGPVFWPAAGLGLGALLITPRSRWPAVLAAVFVAEAVSNAIYQVSIPAGLGWALANTLHPLIAVSLIRRFHPRFRLTSPSELAALVLFGGVVGPAVSASLGTATSVLWWDGQWASIWGWWVGDGLGALVIAPLFVALRAPTIERTGTERLLGAGLFLATTVLVFRNWGSDVDMVLPYLVLPPLVWAALRLGLRGAAVSVAVLGTFGGWSTSFGYGPFAATADGSAVVLFQLYLGVVLVTALLIAVLVADLTEREEIQRAVERRRRQQAALAEFGQRVLLAQRPREVLDHLDVALHAITASPADVGGDAPPSGSLARVDPWDALSEHAEVVASSGIVQRHRIGPEERALAASATTLAANALDRIAQDERLRHRAHELEDLNDQLGRALTFRDQLVSMVSHELRSPLTPILGFTDVLRRGVAGGDAREQQVALDAIERNARRILALIDELLLSARVAEGELATAPAPTDLARTIRAALELVDDSIPVTAAAGSPVVAMVDPGQLQQCVVNLVTNAAKYGERPIEVHVRAEDGAWALVEVSDAGPGVPDEVLPVLFERFTRASGLSSDPAGGVGLGLSIVQALVVANGGTVTYRPPHDGSRTTFTLRLPITPPSDRAAGMAGD